MELRHLRYFVAIAEERSFTRAAERLWIAQPGLSTQIRRLERELGVQLFERHTRGVNLTGAGELLLERARVALAAAEAARCTGRDLEAGLVGSVRLGIATCAGWHGAAGLLASFARDRPDVEVTVVESYGGTLVRDLRDGRLDAVLAPAMFGSPELRRVPMGREPWLVVAGGSHPLAGGDGPVTAFELQGEPFVVTGHRDAAAYDRAVAETLADLGVACELRRGGSGPALLAAVASGDALALATARDAAASGLAARALEPARTVEFALFSQDQTPAPALDRFIRVAAASATAAEPERRFHRAIVRAA
jgi:DNA-binding transcriptional LysR family regulator